MIQFQEINKSFGKLRVLNNLSMELLRGQSVAIVGPNGSGKTTLIKTILGMVVPDSGSILFDGQAIGLDANYRSRIGYMPQIGRYPDNMSIGQLFEMMQDLRDQPSSHLDRDLIDAFKLEHLFHKTMRTLSGGTRQKVSAALAFMFNPDVLILDEPTAGLDPLSCELLKEKVLLCQQQNKLLILTSHIMSDLEELSTHIAYLSDGNCLFYKPIKEIKNETGQMRLGKAIAQIMAGEYQC
ncbi:MAG: ABC transporter ATP-binding protein [Saprospiraceae bacterium]